MSNKKFLLLGALLSLSVAGNTYADSLNWSSTYLYNGNPSVNVSLIDMNSNYDSSHSFPSAYIEIPGVADASADASYVVSSTNVIASASTEFNWTDYVMSGGGSATANFHGAFTVSSSSGATTVNVIIDTTLTGSHENVILIENYPIDDNHPDFIAGRDNGLYINVWDWMVHASIGANSTPITFNVGQTYYIYVYAFNESSAGVKSWDGDNNPVEWFTPDSSTQQSGNVSSSEQTTVTFNFGEPQPTTLSYDHTSVHDNEKYGYSQIDHIVFDNSGNQYHAGRADVNTDLNGDPLAQDFATAPYFISKIDSSGNYVSSYFFDVKGKIMTDSQGNLFRVGYFNTTIDMDPTAATNMTSPQGTADIFISKFNADWSYAWSKTIGSSTGGTVIPFDIASRNNGSLYISGYFNGTVDFDTGVGVHQRTSTVSNQPYILKLDENLVPQWNITPSARVSDLALDGLNNIYGFGFMYGVSSTSLIKYNQNGVAQWNQIFDGGDGKWHDGLAADQNGVYIAGEFDGPIDLDPTSGVDSRNSSYRDLFVTKLDTNGNYAWSHTFGSRISKNEYMSAMVVDNSGNLFLSGHVYIGIDFNPGPGYTSVSPINGGTYFVRLNTDGDFFSATETDTYLTDYGHALSVAPDGAIIQSGVAAKRVGSTNYGNPSSYDFDPGTAQDILPVDPGGTAFYTKWNLVPLN